MEFKFESDRQALNNFSGFCIPLMTSWDKCLHFLFVSPGPPSSLLHCSLCPGGWPLRTALNSSSILSSGWTETMGSLAGDQEEGGKCSWGIYSPRSLMVDCVLTEGHSTPPTSQVLDSFIPTGPLAGLFTVPAVSSPEHRMSLCVKWSLFTTALSYSAWLCWVFPLGTEWGHRGRGDMRRDDREHQVDLGCACVYACVCRGVCICVHVCTCAGMCVQICVCEVMLLCG